jgi:hypothetical protein
MSNGMGFPSAPMFAMLIAKGVAEEAAKQLVTAVEALGPDAHRALTFAVEHIKNTPATEMGSGDPDAPWQGP